MEDIFQSFKGLIKKIAGQVQRTHQNQNLTTCLKYHQQNLGIQLHDKEQHTAKEPNQTKPTNKNKQTSEAQTNQPKKPPTFQLFWKFANYCLFSKILCLFGLIHKTTLS